MIQTLYGIIAILMVATLSLTMNRSIQANETRMIMNELTAQVTPIATDVFDFIGTLPYDAAIISSLMLTDKNLLQEPIAASPFCTPSNNFASCTVMNDIHEKDLVRTVKGLTYNVAMKVEYLDEVDPTTLAGAGVKTFFKRVTLTFTSPELTMVNTGEPLEIELTRRYNYPRVTG